MSYQFYKMLHIISIVLFFALYASAAVKAKNKMNFKFETIFTGILLLVILTAGMGLKKFAAPGAWPLWVNLKLGIWAIIGVSAHMVLKRFPDKSVKFFWFSVVLLTLSSYLANYKI